MVIMELFLEYGAGLSPQFFLSVIVYNSYVALWSWL